MALPKPPQWAVRLLQRICPTEVLEEVEGDLHEAFVWRHETRGSAYAKRKYIWEVFKSFHQVKIKVKTQHSGIMLLHNYFKTGLRFLWKTRGYSTLNILGLAIGIAISWLAFVFVTDEYSFDGFYEKADRTYRIKASMGFGDKPSVFAGSSYLMGEELPRQIAGIELSSRYKSGFFLGKIDREFINQVTHYADGDFFDIFDVNFLIGEAGTFNEPSTVVISESTALRYGIPADLSSDEITLVLDNEEARFKVIGIYRDFPGNTSIRPEILMPFSLWAQANQRRTTIWFDINMNCFFTLAEGVSVNEVEQQMTDILLQNDEFEADVALGLQPLTDIHLNPELRTGNGINARGDNQMILITAIIGAFCLLIACVNYANFAVGNYLVRLKEVALRKVFGAEKTGIFKQFVVEAFTSSFLALFLSVGIIYIIMPAFATYANKSYELSVIFSQKFLLGGVGIMLLSTVLAGLYPALLLSRFKTVAGLKGKARLGGRNLLSKMLVTLQFCIAVFLLASMLTLNKQLNFLLNYDIGYNGENLVRIFRPIEEESLKNTFKNRLLGLSGIQNVSIASGFNGTDYRTDEGEQVIVRHARVDTDYLETMGMELLQGRNFDPGIATDFTKACIVNEAFVKARGMENAVGTTINFSYGDFSKPTIIGVVKNFNFESLHTPVQPLILYMGGYLTTYDTHVKVDAMNQALMEQIEAIHNEMFAPYPLNYTLVEDDIANQYELETNIQKVSRGGSIIAIVLSCMGLMGFVGTQIRQRLKEVSIRKVVGARARQIFGLYLGKYLLLLILGVVTGISVAYWIMQGWLNNYPEHVSFGMGIMFFSVSSVLVVAILTIYSQLFKAMRLNPVKYLKEE
ncbi:MAG: ABC transporter permease [Bacteroidota bacterium]|nr:ABC transporter permease [Bacteroidota bacterium]